jgi:hypothetical protein
MSEPQRPGCLDSSQARYPIDKPGFDKFRQISMRSGGSSRRRPGTGRTCPADPGLKLGQYEVFECFCQRGLGQGVGHRRDEAIAVGVDRAECRDPPQVVVVVVVDGSVPSQPLGAALGQES